jgi:hypothetical protein
MIVFTSSLVSLLYGVTAGGSVEPWASAKIITPLVLGFCGIASFVVYEGKWAQQPMVPLRIFYSRTAASGYISSWLHALVMWSVGYYLILYVSKFSILILVDFNFRILTNTDSSSLVFGTHSSPPPSHSSPASVSQHRLLRLPATSCRSPHTSNMLTFLAGSL